MKEETKRLVLEGQLPEDTAPKVAVYCMDRRGKILAEIPVDAKGQFQLPEGMARETDTIRIGPSVPEGGKFEDLPADAFLTWRSSAFTELVSQGELVIPRDRWICWLFPGRLVCLNGKVRHCRPFYWLVKELVAEAHVSRLSQAQSPKIVRAPANAMGTAVSALPKLRPLFPQRCAPVCDGIVEVYRRTCCRRPWIIDDPRLFELIDELEKIIPTPWPPDPWPPGPEPGPGPWPGPTPGPDPAPDLTKKLFKDGALDYRVLNAARDSAALRELPKLEQAAYIEARPHLWLWDCGTPTQVATGHLQPGGAFTICYRDSRCLFNLRCHDEYAFKVRQVINGVSVTIYDGVAAGQWFHPQDDAQLTSYHWFAVSCQEDGGPQEGGAFVLLQDIGSAHSYRLKTPNSTGWNRVGAAVYNDGLLDPAPSAADALGNTRNSNWGGSLALRCKFSESMNAVGAEYYRISVRPTDASGQPTGAPTYFNGGLSWLYYEVVGTDIFVKIAALGPDTVGGESHLYKIPYNLDRDWLSGQYHAGVETTAFADGRFLITIEVFNGAGQRLRPNAVPAGENGLGTAAAFTYRRWFQETGPTAEVPFAALTHMFWWDNRKAQAEIADLRRNGVPNTGECQFIDGCASDLFSAGYRAYHPQPMFQLSHGLSWKRGLGGSSGSLTPPVPARYQNAGQPPALPAASAAETVGNMLEGNPRCSFALNLSVHVKTTNGSGRLDSLDDYRQAAFALAAIPCIPPP